MLCFFLSQIIIKKKLNLPLIHVIFIHSYHIFIQWMRNKALCLCPRKQKYAQDEINCPHAKGSGHWKQIIRAFCIFQADRFIIQDCLGKLQWSLNKVIHKRMIKGKRKKFLMPHHNSHWWHTCVHQYISLNVLKFKCPQEAQFISQVFLFFQLTAISEGKMTWRVEETRAALWGGGFLGWTKLVLKRGKI